MTDFSGRWITTFGPMELTQTGDQVEGTYGAAASLHGTVVGGRLVFQYEEPNTSGEGWFELERYGKFHGLWRAAGTVGWAPWHGQRGFDGVWDTSFGPMRLYHHDNRIHGYYDGLGAASVEGAMHGDRFVFRYQEPKAAGDGWFTLAPDGFQFGGEWRADGQPMWAPWLGKRVLPRSGRRWLVVLEAHWQRSLDEEEYSFGQMLHEFFARVPGVGVRHRFFQNEAGLEKWCRELRYLVEPTVLAIATHGTQEGLVAHGVPIRPEIVVNNLKSAENVTLVHFSACMMLHDGPAGDLARSLQRLGQFPVSGYTTSVDWAASAILEFTYFDLILSRGLDPAAAAEHVYQLLGFAGEDGFPAVGFPGAGFRFLPPTGA